jgi:hypothetical protein
VLAGTDSIHNDRARFFVDVPAIAKPDEAALAGISADELETHRCFRRTNSKAAPGNEGEDLTVNYLTEQFKQLGLAWKPRWNVRSKESRWQDSHQNLSVFSVAGGKKLTLDYSKDYIARSLRYVPDVKIDNSDVVFVGYGVVAPEYGWDDFKGIDKRETIVSRK